MTHSPTDTKALRLALSISNDPSEPRANRDMADVAIIAAAPALLDEIDGYRSGEHRSSAHVAALETVVDLVAERDSLKSEVERLRVDSERWMLTSQAQAVEENKLRAENKRLRAALTMADHALGAFADIYPRSPLKLKIDAALRAPAAPASDGEGEASRG